jgi:hypothetical protein
MGRLYEEQRNSNAACRYSRVCTAAYANMKDLPLLVFSLLL